MKTVLVTGASGFIGRHLVSALASQGYRVRCLVRRSSSRHHLRRAGAELYEGDVTDAACLDQPLRATDVVFHAAGLIHAGDRAQLMRINAGGTENVVRACARQATPPTLVVVSSLAAAGPTRRSRLREAADPPAPVSDYGVSKRAGELAAAAWAERVPCTIVRPGIVFGPWDRTMLPAFRSIARIGIHPIPTFAPPPLSLIYVQDLVQLLLAAAERGTRLAPAEPHVPAQDHSPGYYFACMDQYPDYTQLGRLIAHAVGRRHLLLFHLAEPLPWLVAGTTQLIARGLGQAAMVNLDKMREATVASWASSPQAAREQLGFSPPASLPERLQQTADWYRARRWL
jgi:nucleoside-diphosphate-sugar epimerase